MRLLKGLFISLPTSKHMQTTKYFHLVEPYPHFKPQVVKRTDWPDGVYESIVHDMQILKYITQPTRLLRLRDRLIQFYTWYYRAIQVKLMIVQLPSTGCDEDIASVDRRLAEILLPQYLCLETIFDENEIVNGYPIPVSKNVIGFGLFLNLKEYFTEAQTPRPSFEEFWQWFDQNAYSEWNKMNRLGEYVGYIDGQRFDNARGLYELPYPLEFVKKTIEIGCNSGYESVAYSNFLGATMTRLINRFSDELYE